MSHRSRQSISAVIALVLLTVNISAAQVATSFEELRQQQRLPVTVVVTDHRGHNTRGRLISVNGSSIELQTGGAVPQRSIYTVSEVREIRKTGSGWIGELVGLGAGIAVSAALCERDGECRGSRTATVSPMHVSGPIMLASLIGGPLLGSAIERRPRATIYMAPAGVLEPDRR
jgi:hypothetical protein